MQLEKRNMEITSLVKGIVTGQLTNLLKGIAKDFSEEITHIVSNNILEYQIEEYNRNSISKTLLHRVEPKRLKEFYQPLFVRKCGKNSKRGGIDDYRFINERKEDRISTESIANFIIT